MQLTHRQAQALEYIRDYTDVHGVAPTDAEVARWLGVCPSRGNEIVWRLSELGCIFRESRVGRSVEIAGGA